jgi:alkylhydroperoxidase family enzyme
VTPRLRPLPPDRWDDDVRAALRDGFTPEAADRYLSGRPDALPMPNAVSTLLHHPRLARRWLAFNSVLLFAPALDVRLRELMILRVAWRTGAPYEWAQHVRLAQGCGVTADEIDAIGAPLDAGPWSALEADVLAATDELLAGYRIDDRTWERLAVHLDEQQLTELVFVVGAYTCLAMAFNSFALELDPDLEAQPMPPGPATDQRGTGI